MCLHGGHRVGNQIMCVFAVVVRLCMNLLQGVCRLWAEARFRSEVMQHVSDLWMSRGHHALRVQAQHRCLWPQLTHFGQQLSILLDALIYILGLNEAANDVVLTQPDDHQVNVWDVVCSVLGHVTCRNKQRERERER